MTQLLWHPLYAAVEGVARTGDRLNWIIAPFVKRDALGRLFEAACTGQGLKLISRWRPGDLIAGVSDIEVFDYLKRMKCELYIHQRLHMKLFAFESNKAMITSGNLTLRGMGYVESNVANIEVGTFVSLTGGDWVNLYRVVRESRLMTDDLYERYKKYVNSIPPPLELPNDPDLLGPAKRFTLASLPATNSPEELAAFYFDPTAFQGRSEAVRRGYQDLATFHIPGDLGPEEFHAVLGKSFCESHFVSEFIAHLRDQTSLRFGQVNAWIHEKCEDVPLPYRWEIKGCTHAFYNWLAHFVPEIRWDRPHHSQVIYWG